MESPPNTESCMQDICTTEAHPISRVRPVNKVTQLIRERPTDLQRGQTAHPSQPSQPAKEPTRAQGLEHLCKRLPALSNRDLGERVDFPDTVEIAGQRFTSAVIERDFKTASGARLLRFL